MTNREYHADGLEFAFKTFTALTADQTIAPTPIEVANAIEHIRVAAKFLRKEQEAFDFFTENNED